MEFFLVFSNVKFRGSKSDYLCGLFFYIEKNVTRVACFSFVLFANNGEYVYFCRG